MRRRLVSLPYRAATASGREMVSKTPAKTRRRFATKKSVTAHPMAIVVIIHTELIPMRYTRPGPPTKPKPLIMLEKRATPVTSMPRLRPAMKKSRDDLVRRSAQIPTPMHMAI